MEKEKNNRTNGDFRADNLRGSGHLSDDEIIAYQYGNLSSIELEELAQNHLIECRRCTGALLELNAFAETATTALNAGNTDAQWTQFEQKRRAATIEVAQDSMTEQKTAIPFWHRFFKFPAFNFAGAAAFGVLALIILGGIFLAFFRPTENSGIGESAAVVNTPPQINGNVSPLPQKSPTDQQTNAIENDSTNVASNSRIFKHGKQTSSSPPPKSKNKAATANVNSSLPPKIIQTLPFQNELALNRIDVSLYPNEIVRGDADNEVRKIRVSQTSVRQIRLKLNAPKSQTLTAFSFEITDSQNQAVLTLPILPDKRGDFYLTIPANKLPAAAYSLKIYAEKSKIRRVYAEYDFEIVYE